MARCFAFDKPTAQAISRNLHLLTICNPEADPVQTALRSTSPTSLLALPMEGGKRVLVARFRRFSPALEAGGFLGLSDRLAFAPEPQPAKKWWQRFLE